MHSEKDDYIRPDEIEKLNSLDTQERLISVFFGGHGNGRLHGRGNISEGTLQMKFFKYS